MREVHSDCNVTISGNQVISDGVLSFTHVPVLSMDDYPTTPQQSELTEVKALWKNKKKRISLPTLIPASLSLEIISTEFVLGPINDSEIPLILDLSSSIFFSCGSCQRARPTEMEIALKHTHQ